MEIFGIGPLELIFIFLIALIVLGPTDMVKAGKTIGRFLRKLVTSPTWQSFQRASRDLRYLPNRLMREAGMEEDIKAIEEIARQTRQVGSDITLDPGEGGQDLSSWTTPPANQDYRPVRPSIAPPRQKSPPGPVDGESSEDPG
jgi:Sec-independent protein translocase protein TatA